MKKKALLSWSSGKDSALALHLLNQQSETEVIGLFSTVNEDFGRVAMHAVREELLHQQAQSIGLPIQIIHIPHSCSNFEYEVIMGQFVNDAKEHRVECMVFGDILLRDVRKSREHNLAGTGIIPLFPLWGISTDKLCHEIIASGLRAQITCVDPKHLSPDFAGREYNKSFLEDIPDTVDPCGENGEFHTFVFDGPMFDWTVDVSLGEIVERDGFVFADLLSGAYLKQAGLR